MTLHQAFEGGSRHDHCATLLYPAILYEIGAVKTLTRVHNQVRVGLQVEDAPNQQHKCVLSHAEVDDVLV